MKIKNTTEYDNNDLKNFIYECGNQMELRKVTAHLKVEIRSKKKRRWTGNESEYPSGRAYVGKVWHDYNAKKAMYQMSLRIPDNVKKRRLAFVVSHELLHCAGFHHKEIDGMKFHDWSECDGEKFAYADNLLLNPKQYNVKPPRDIRNERHEKAIRMVKQYQSKVKRDTNLLKKWQSKVKYYERTK